MDAADFLDALNDMPVLRTALQRYSMALLTQVVRVAACNRLHSRRQRASRWIVETHDRVDADHFPLPDEFLAQMLGVDLPAVRTATQELAELGLVQYHGDTLEVCDRAALEAAACTCYEIVRQEFERLLTPVD